MSFKRLIVIIRLNWLSGRKRSCSLLKRWIVLMLRLMYFVLSFLSFFCLFMSGFMSGIMVVFL